ncbi:hypothetical protein M0R89_22810 (plasmid) [Halorussus limi]|uniref:Uncharacterized protein n=1 Tax=Halorussus limi TaxID=2938695 RepID=A0A8U0I1G3_9EURY|nr:hypothetical protein [Halorussus limi]UPV77205.1 hypothetical protein M0R89_22810 [Halorussus limi]
MMVDDSEPDGEVDWVQKFKKRQAKPTHEEWYVQFRDDTYTDVISNEQVQYKNHLVHVRWTEGYEDEKTVRVVCNRTLDPTEGELVSVEELEREDLSRMCANCGDTLRSKLSEQPTSE